MRGIVVVTGLDQLPPTERWPRLVAPLAAELAGSGLGHMPDLDALRREAVGNGALGSTEVAVHLANLDHGRRLVCRAVESAGVRPHAGAMPERWRGYSCSDYFGSDLAEHGYWDEASQYWCIRPSDQIHEDPDLGFLVIGGPGVDGISWGYRPGQSGVWAYPIEGRFVWLAPTACDLLQGWLAGTITV
jgi:hypothetical protein